MTAPIVDLVSLAREAPVHFMGVGGAGMEPLAELVVHSGGRVTGCDAKDSPAIRRLAEAGVGVAVGHDPSHVAGCSALVVTAAVPADHPEIAAARAAGIPVLKRAHALGGIVNEGYLVGVAGTHGKTTTTALTTLVLAAAGKDPTGLVGGRVVGWKGNLRAGGHGLFVVEADEYDRSFHTLRPTIAVVTTMEADHLDIYGTLAAVEDAFLEYLDRVPAGGLIVASADDMGVGRLLPRVATTSRSIVTYGTSAGSMVRADEISHSGRSMSFTVRERGDRLGRVTISLPGIHNVRNSLAAVAVARHLGADMKEIAEGLASYAGVERRFEHVGEAAGVTLVDDYAHHPTEISATLEAARAAHPRSRLVAVFQPHLYSRTRDFAAEFGRSLAAADLLFVAGIYAAREDPIPGVSAELIVNAARELGAEVHYLSDRDELPAVVAEALRPGDLCVTLGAGDLNVAARDILELVRNDG